MDQKNSHAYYFVWIDGCRELCYLQMKQPRPSHPKERIDLVKVRGVGLKGRCVKGQVGDSCSAGAA